jgi:hypothetical protein
LILPCTATILAPTGNPAASAAPPAMPYPVTTPCSDNLIPKLPFCLARLTTMVDAMASNSLNGRQHGVRCWALWDGNCASHGAYRAAGRPVACTAPSDRSSLPVPVGLGLRYRKSWGSSCGGSWGEVLSALTVVSIGSFFSVIGDRR